MIRARMPRPFSLAARPAIAHGMIAGLLSLTIAGCGDDEATPGGDETSTTDGPDSDPTTFTTTSTTSSTTTATGSSTDTTGGETDDTTTGSSDTDVETGTSGGPCDSPASCADDAEDATADALDELRGDDDGIFDFLVEMPLGGDLHHHLSGGVYAEAYMAWADNDGGFCLTQSSLSLSTSCGDGNDVPIPSGRRELYLDVLRAWSMFDFDPNGGVSGADHFFSTFSKFGAVSGTRHGLMLADIRRRAAAENVIYIEPMLTSNSTARSLGESTWSDLGGGSLGAEDYPALHDALVASGGFPAARARLVNDADDNEAIAESELGCNSDDPSPACDVVTRYQAYISRSGSDAGIFGQMVAAYEAAMVEPRIVGLNLVGPEDGSAAMANYDRLMAMLGFLNEEYDGISPLRLSLHAGEITAESIPNGYQLDETQHIRKAVDIAGARRIGHGVDVLEEGEPDALLDSLREQQILVEICFASNDIILEVTGPSHPVHDYLAAGVPVSLATDDQGVARSSMAAEFFRGVVDIQLNYYELKGMVRSSIEYSFLDGESFWSDYGELTVADACAPAAGDTPVTQPPSGACETFLQNNPRAALQRELEARFEAFEAEFVARR